MRRHTREIWRLTGLIWRNNRPAIDTKISQECFPYKDNLLCGSREQII
jgi:hypothetical protein